jgi:hypothetical protein
VRTRLSTESRAGREGTAALPRPRHAPAARDEAGGVAVAVGRGAVDPEVKRIGLANQPSVSANQRLMCHCHARPAVVNNCTVLVSNMCTKFSTHFAISPFRHFAISRAVPYQAHTPSLGTAQGADLHARDLDDRGVAGAGLGLVGDDDSLQLLRGGGGERGRRARVREDGLRITHG